MDAGYTPHSSLVRHNFKRRAIKLSLSGDNAPLCGAFSRERALEPGIYSSLFSVNITCSRPSTAITSSGKSPAVLAAPTAATDRPSWVRMRPPLRVKFRQQTILHRRIRAGLSSNNPASGYRILPAMSGATGSSSATPRCRVLNQRNKRR